MKLNYSIAMVTLLAKIPSTLADPDPVGQMRQVHNMAGDH